MNYFNAYTALPDIAKALPHLQRTIIERTRTGVMTPHGYNIEIKANLSDVADAVESAYILTPKADVPKVTKVDDRSTTGLGRTYYFDGQTLSAKSMAHKPTAAYARKHANEWLAIARHLETEEKAKAYEEAKAKAVKDAMEKAAENARLTRLNELADEWFGKDYDDLGPNKAAAIKEIHRLETIINEEDAA